MTKRCGSVASASTAGRDFTKIVTKKENVDYLYIYISIS